MNENITVPLEVYRALVALWRLSREEYNGPALPEDHEDATFEDAMTRATNAVTSYMEAHGIKSQ